MCKNACAVFIIAHKINGGWCNRKTRTNKQTPQRTNINLQALHLVASKLHEQKFHATALTIVVTFKLYVPSPRPENSVSPMDDPSSFRA